MMRTVRDALVLPALVMALAVAAPASAQMMASPGPAAPAASPAAVDCSESAMMKPMAMATMSGKADTDAEMMMHAHLMMARGMAMWEMKCGKDPKMQAQAAKDLKEIDDVLNSIHWTTTF